MSFNSDFVLTNDQQTGLRHIGEFFTNTRRAMSITGSAGTGKTTMMQAAQEFGKFAVAAPTHKAKLVIAQKTKNSSAYTLAELIGLAVDDDIADFNPNLPKFIPKNEPKLQLHGRFFIDEASMINQELYGYLMNLAEQFNTKLVFIGDTCQLPPVKEVSDSLALTDTGFVFELRQVVRQTLDNPLSMLLLALRCDILHLSQGTIDPETLEAFEEACDRFDAEQPDILGKYFGTLLRDFEEGLMTEDGKGWTVYNDSDDVENQIRRFIEANIDFKTLAYTNTRVGDFNLVIRRGRYGSNAAPIVKGERLMAYSSIKDSNGRTLKVVNSVEYSVQSVTPGIISFEGVRLETFQCHLLDRDNGNFVFTHILSPVSYDAYNGLMSKLYHAAKKSRPEWRNYYKVKEAVPSLCDHANVYNNQALPYKMFDYADAMTTHKSQGSTYDNVIVDGTNIAAVKHLAKDLEPADREIFMRKLLYVAISRARTHATIYFKK